MAYPASVRMLDPLAFPDNETMQNLCYRYNRYDPAEDFPSPDDAVYVRIMHDRFGPCITYGNGPTSIRGQVPVSTAPPITILLEYDPTNGTISPGRIMRYPKQKA